MMVKVDFKKKLRHLYQPSKKEFTFVDVPPMNFLMIDGQGDPNQSSIFQEATSTLYAVAYTLKFALKGDGYDYIVPPLEGLWWAEDMAAFNLDDKASWKWTLMIMQPDRVNTVLVRQACIEAAKKKDLPLVASLRFAPYDEGLAVQIMYLGAYADEGPTIQRMHAFIAQQGYERRGLHHEIYLGDPRRTAPEKLKTVIRQPVAKLPTSI